MKYLLFLGFWLFAGVAFAGEPTLVYFVRHAEKVDDSADPQLSAPGKERAAWLENFFSEIEIDQVFASQYQRTIHTVKPVAESHGKEVVVVDAGKPEVLVEKLKAADGGIFLVAGHSNTVPDLIKRCGGPEFEIDHEDYDNLFLVILDGEQTWVQRFRIKP